MSTNAPKNGHEQTPSPAVYFLSLTVNNFRAFGPDPVTLDLSDAHGNPAPWTILLGDNGTGKTTLLQLLAVLQPVLETIKFGKDDEREAIVPAIAARDQRVSGVRDLWQDIIHPNRQNRIVAKIGARQSESHEFGIDVDGPSHNKRVSLAYSVVGVSHPDIDGKDLLDLQCIGYGASRRMSRNAVADGIGKDACQTLFDDTSDLINAEDWLIRADYASKLGGSRSDNPARMRLQQIIDILLDVLPDVSEFEYGAAGDNNMTPFIEAVTPSGPVRVANLSLGYKTTLAWVVDFAARMFERYPKSENPLAEPAVCLVDEIDLHLHPRWQRKLIADLSRIFPRTQFIVTAHSPLIVQAAPNANLALLQWKGEHVEIDNDVDHIRRWRVDQILASELFGEQPTHAREVEDLFDQRTRLAQKSKLTRKEKVRLTELDAEIDRLPTAAAPEDREAMDIIRRAAALLQKEL